MDVASTVGRGATLWVWLPCAKTTAKGTTEATLQANTSARVCQTSTVLIVEDEDVLRKGAAKMLRNTGFKVLEAANGSAAINLLHGHEGKIDVILLDATIPGASSHEVVSEAVQALPEIRVILTSAYGQEMLTHLMSAPQIRGFIRKPFHLRNLVEMIQSALLMGARTRVEHAK
jgi:two-component system, cell cycle sensor histidine kinase and response regulator CckA